MLLQLQVKNYAIIDEVTINFSRGLNIITGETGAGKSILLGALGLVLGDRADLNVLFDVSTKCIIEATFDVSNRALDAFFVEHDIDESNELILRRELLPTSRSRAFVNDTPVKLKQLQKISERLINVHRQFATLDIFTRPFQTKILDTLAKQQSGVIAYQKLFYDYKLNVEKITRLHEVIANASREYDFIKFQIDEIEEFQLNPKEDEQIEVHLKRAEQADETKNDLLKLDQLLHTDEISASHILYEAQKIVSQLTKRDEQFKPFEERLSSLKIELEDLSAEIAQASNMQSLSQEEISHLSMRYDKLQRLYFKHQVGNVSALQQLLESMKAKVTGNNQDIEHLEKINKDIQEQILELEKIAVQLFNKRQFVAPKLKKKVEKILSELAMENAVFEACVSETSELHNLGSDMVEFKFSANPGSDLLPLKLVASGGELSRLSLALKSVIANELALPTMVFDEIDSGVSGHTALRMGKMLRDLGNSHQAIVITHSAQVAAQGQSHYFVAKESESGSTTTKISKLEETERLHKIAIMLSSDPPSKAAQKNAEELLELSK